MASKKVGMGNIFEDFASRTTMHGMNTLASAPSIKAKMFWSVVCLGSMAMFSFMLSRLVKQYLEYPVNVNIEEVRMISVLNLIMIALIHPILLQCISSYTILANPELGPQAPNTYQSELVPGGSINSNKCEGSTSRQ